MAYADEAALKQTIELVTSYVDQKVTMETSKMESYSHVVTGSSNNGHSVLTITPTESEQCYRVWGSFVGVPVDFIVCTYVGGLMRLIGSALSDLLVTISGDSDGVLSAEFEYAGSDQHSTAVDLMVESFSDFSIALGEASGSSTGSGDDDGDQGSTGTGDGDESGSGTTSGDDGSGSNDNTGTGDDDGDDDDDSTADAITALQQDVLDLQQAVADAKSQATTNAASIEIIQGAIDNLGSIYATVDSLNTVAATISILEDVIGSIDSKYVTKEDFEDLQASVDSLKTTVDVIESTYITKDTLTTIEDEFIAMGNDIQEVRESLDGYATEEFVTTTVTESIENAGHATTEYVDAAVDTLKTEVSDTYPTITALNELLGAYATDDEVNAVLANYVTSEALSTTVGEYAKITDVDDQISVVSDAIANVTSVVSTINESYATTEYVDATVIETEKSLTASIESVQATIDGLGDTYATTESVESIQTVVDEIPDTYATKDDLAVVESEAEAGIDSVRTSLQTLDTDIQDAYVSKQYLEENAVLLSSVGVANGVASLDENGKVPASQLPVEGSCSVNGVGYETMSDAIAACEAGTPVTITMEEDSSENITVDAGKEITIDLNGCTLTTTGNNGLTVDGGSTLTLTGSGTVVGESIGNTNALALVSDGSTLVLDGADISAPTSFGIMGSSGANVVINSGSITSLNPCVSSNNTTGDCNLEINGGTLTSANGPAVYLPAQNVTIITDGVLNGGISLRMGNVTISGGEINATTGEVDPPVNYYSYSGNVWFPDALYVLAGTYNSDNETLGNSLSLNITGGTFSTTNESGSAIAIYDCGKIEQSASVEISGTAVLKNTADDRDAYAVLSLEDIGVTNPATGYGAYSGNVSTSITGGTFSTDVKSEYLGEGCSSVQNEDGTFSVAAA